MRPDTPPPLRSKVIAPFWPRAVEARIAFEEFMGRHETHTFDGPHQCWDYWYVAHTYCYLRTNPVKVLGPILVEDFLTCLRQIAKDWKLDAEPLGPWLTLHMPGMRHELHNDGQNGKYAYIFSLTKEPFTFSGGETCLTRQGVFDSQERQFRAWCGYLEVFPPRFNQLLVFDDRIPHCVPVVQGTFNPLEGRLCLTGHLR